MADQSFTSKPENLTEERSEAASGGSIGRGKAILVAGMHRSGTSAMTRVLSLAGAGLPRTLMPPAADNPTGFWESGPVAQLNDELLREIGSRWDDVFGFVSRPDAARFRTSAVSRIRQCLDREFAATSLPVIKDPRLSLLMDLWIPALQQSQYDPCVVALVRNPLEVAASLQQRNGFPSAKSSLVWAAYTLAVERSTRSLPRLFVDYEELTQDWRTVLSRTESALGIVFPQLTVSSQLEIERYLAKGERHHLASRAQLRARRDLAPWVARIYDSYRQADGGILEPDTPEIDAVFAEMGAAAQIFAPIVVDLSERLDQAEQTSAIDRETAKARIDALDAHRIELEQARGEDARLHSIEQDNLSARIKEAQTRAESLEGELETAKARIDALDAHRIELEQARGEDARLHSIEQDNLSARIKEAQTRAETLEGELETAKAGIDALDAHRIELERARGEDARLHSIEQDNLSARIKEAQTRAESLEGELETAKARIDALDAHRIELEQARGEDARLHSIEQDNLSARIKEAQTRAETLEGELETAKARADALDAHRIELEQARGQDQEAFQRERSALAAQARAAQEQVAAAVKAHEQVLDQKVREICRLEEEAALLEQRCADLEASRRKIEGERTREERRLIEELDQAQHRVKALDAHRAELEAARWQDELNHTVQLATATGELRDAEQAIRALDAHRQELETARWRDAERSDFVLDGTITAASAQLCQLQDRLESAGTSIIEAQRQLVTLSEEGRRARWQAFEQAAAPQSGPAALSKINIVRRVLRRTSLGRSGLIALSGLWDRRSAPLFSQLRTYARGNGPSPHPLFDEAFYKAHSPDIATQGEIGLVHYLGYGCSEGRDPHPLFDVRWYRAQAGSTLEAYRMSALQHYLYQGAREGKNPHPLFDTAYYVSRAATLDIKTDNPLIHYLLGGWRSGASPHPLFDTEYYIERYPDVLRANVPPLLHYVQTGWREGRDPHPLFATSWYLSQNPDVAAAGLEPLRHYLLKGGAERRDPSPLFPSREYLDGNPDVESAGVNPLVHFLQRGAFEARLPLAGFDAVAYATGTPALAASELPPLLHAVRNEALHQVFPLRSNFEAELRGHVQALDEAARSQSPAPSFAGPPAGPARLPSAAAESYPADRPSASGQQDGLLFTDLESTRAQAEDAYDWPAYLKLRTSLTAARRKYIECLELPAPEMISLSGRSLEETARRLKFDRTSSPAVSIIIPAFNNAIYTLECLAALRNRLGRIEAEVIVADDASTDETAGLMQLIDGLVHLRSEENRGFLRNCNGAAEKARGRILIFLNNDVQVQPGWLEPLVGALADPGIAIAAPKLLFPNGRLQEAGARLNPDGSAQLIGLFDDPRLARFNSDRDVDYASGACIAIAKALFTDLGGFDDTLAPAYCEDVDLCYRARERGLRVRYVASSEVVHHLSVTSNALPGDYKLAQVRRNTQRIIGRWGKQVSEDNRVKVIANYLPQFHTIPENDRWWGAGFTEWTNVTRALPNYSGHAQPRRPGELGYYDLTNPGVLEAQTDLARRHGIDGFCVYYYWFAGRRILERPLDMIAERHDLGFPFCICWANENWTRTWDGQDREVLLAQTYSDDDDEAVIRDMLRYIRAPHYIRVQGKPLVILYRPSLLPDARRTADRWRAICRAQGVGEIYLAFVETFENALTYPDPASIGFDATIEFPPSGVSNPISLPGKRFNPRFEGVVSDYMTTVRRYFAEPVPGHRRFRGVMPSWDNTARRQDRSYSYHDASPGAFQAWLEWAMAVTREQNPSGERFVFVNAWNEWAEGAYLEPDKRIGRGWLEAVRNAHDAHLWPRSEDN